MSTCQTPSPTKRAKLRHADACAGSVHAGVGGTQHSGELLFAAHRAQQHALRGVAAHEQRAADDCQVRAAGIRPPAPPKGNSARRGWPARSRARRAHRARRRAARKSARARREPIAGLRVLHFLPGDVAVVVGVDEHRPDDVLQRQIPAHRHGRIALRQLQDQEARARRVRERGLRRSRTSRPGTTGARQIVVSRAHSNCAARRRECLR